MTQIKEDVASILKENGFSITKQRLSVFELLNGREPLSMYELYDLTNNNIDRASLYRIIAVFEQLGIVQRINIGWKYKIELSDKFSDHHHHLTCLKCKKIIPINEKELENFIQTVSLNYRFIPKEHQVEIQGFCETCAKGIKDTELKQL